MLDSANPGSVHSNFCFHTTSDAADPANILNKVNPRFARFWRRECMLGFIQLQFEACIFGATGRRGCSRLVLGKCGCRQKNHDESDSHKLLRFHVSISNFLYRFGSLYRQGYIHDDRSTRYSEKMKVLQSMAKISQRFHWRQHLHPPASHVLSFPDSMQEAKVAIPSRSCICGIRDFSVKIYW